MKLLTHFNGRFPRDPGLVNSPSASSPTCCGTEPLGISSIGFTGCTLYLSPNQRRQNTERNSKHWTKAGKITYWRHPFSICHRTPKRRAAAQLTTSALHKKLTADR